MKSKFILLSFMLLFTTGKMLDAVASSELVACGDPATCDSSATFCEYQGMLGNLAEVDEEFAMLLESQNRPNFQSMYKIVAQLLEKVRMSEKNLEALRDPECNVSKYMRKLLTYYDANQEKIEENMKNGSSALDIVNVFESLKKMVGPEFLASITLENLRKEIYGSCSVHTRNSRKINSATYCHHTTALVLMDLLGTIQMLTKELDQLKRQVAELSSLKPEKEI